MKTALGMGLALVLVVTAFTALGLSENNHMLIFGLLLAVISGLVTIALAATAKLQALRATFEPTPSVAQNKSYSFSNTTAIHHYPTEELRELASLRQDLRALQDLHDKAVFEIAALKTHMRLCFDNIRYHEQITLPHALAGQAGAIIVATLMTLVGTALCALPDIAYALAKAVNVLLVNGWQHVSHWRAG